MRISLPKDNAPNAKHNIMTRILRISLFLVLSLFSLLGASAQKTYVVAVGLTDYDKEKNSLPCSVDDARAISNFFDKYTDSEIFMLKNENATRAHILTVLKKLFAKSTEADEVVFAYSGHGFDGGLSCYDSDKVILCSEIQEIMRNVKARRKVMFIMACHSGSFAKKYGSAARNNDYKSKKSNVMLYLSSRANESSWENTGMVNSYFFNRLIQGLKGAADANRDRKVTARELFNFVNRAVINDTNGVQHPQMYGNFPDDMVVVYVK